MANLSKAVCHGESDKCRFGNPPQESNSQRFVIIPHGAAWLLAIAPSAGARFIPS
jgi:hypothetical protein